MLIYQAACYYSFVDYRLILYVFNQLFRYRFCNRLFSSVITLSSLLGSSALKTFLEGEVLGFSLPFFVKEVVMKSYHVEITETLRRTVTVEAHNYDEAINLVREAWKNSQYVLDADDFIDAAFEVVAPVCS